MKIAILGYGTIGSGVFEIFRSNADNIEKKAGEPVEVKYVLDLRDFENDPVSDVLVHDFRVIVEDDEIECAVETMGGTEPAYSFVKELLLRGKSVCTSNKELVAAHGAELLEIARQKKINFFFEASVGGAIPLIRPINESFSADEIVEISGIVNGTTNYILTKMAYENADFSDALSEAQEKGYAERNPEADVEGHDAARKIAILASLACSAQVEYKDIYTEGITKITARDMEYAKQMNKAIKLIASMRKVDNEVFATVSPMLVSNDSPLFTVNGVYNGILVRGKYSGKIMFYGRGAGKLPTASAVSADVVEAVRNRGKWCPILWNRKPVALTDRLDEVNDFFIRTERTDKDSVIRTFGEIADMVEGIDDEVAFVIHGIKEKDFEEKSKGLNIISRIRFLL